MIFFMTILIPSSNISVKLKELQKQLFERNIIIPSPFPLIICTVSNEKPARPSRSLIAEKYPSEIVTVDYKIINESLMLMFEEPFNIESNENPIEGIILGRMNFSNHADIGYPPAEKLSFKKFSIALYELQAESIDKFWLNMSWKKLWEVQKKKT